MKKENKDFEKFKKWCKAKKLKPGNAKSLELYFKEEGKK